MSPTLPPSAGSDAIEQLARRFEILSVLGQGGGSIVYHALDRSRDNLPVAIKLLIHEQAFDEHVIERFREEVRICSTLNHPNLVKAYDLIELQGTVAFTMEYVQGRDLGAILKRGKPSPEKIELIMDQLLGALAELHNHGIVHRDIKLENLLLRDDGVLKLTDLGLMKSPSLAGLTKTGILLGTAQYMPPEYVKQSMYDHRGDIYAAGCVLYELLTGHRRLNDKPGPEALEYLIKTKFQVSKATLNGFPKRFIPIIQQSMEVDPLVRFQSAQSMRDALLESKRREISGEGIVEMKSSLSTPGNLQRLAAAHVAHRTRTVTTRFTNTVVRSLSVSLLLLLVVLAGMYGAERRHELAVVKLAPGVYRGAVSIDTAKGKQERGLVLRVSGSDTQSISFESDLTGCKSGVVDLEKRTLRCGDVTNGFEVRESGLDGKGRAYLTAVFSVPSQGPAQTVRFEQER